MMTFKDLKKLVELPSYKEQRVPTVKALEVSGVPVVAEKVLENHGSINVYQNGYVIYGIADFFFVGFKFGFHGCDAFCHYLHVGHIKI